MKEIACIEDRDAAPLAVIAVATDRKILKHVGLDQSNRPGRSQHNRSPPATKFEQATTLF